MPVSEYNAIFGGPVRDDISQRTGGWWHMRRLKLQRVFKGKQVGWSALTQPARVEDQTGYGRNSNARTLTLFPIDFRAPDDSEESSATEPIADKGRHVALPGVCPQFSISIWGCRCLQTQNVRFRP